MPGCRPFADTLLPAVTRVAAALLCCLLLASCGFRASRTRAEKAVKEFHALLDGARYDLIYDRSDDSLKKSWTRTDFIAYLSDIHSRLGRSGKVNTRGFQVNAIAGQAVEVALAMETEFERGMAEERFVWRIEGDRAVLVDYHADITRSPGPTTV